MSFMDKFLDDLEHEREQERLRAKITILEERVAVLSAECKRLSEELSRAYE